MEITIIPGTAGGTVTAPASKSVMQRACAASLLAGGITNIYNYGSSGDDKAALGIIQSLGADVAYIDEHTLKINAAGIDGGEAIYCGESGLSVRMFTPLVGLWGREVTVNGSGSLLNRPLAFFDTVLPQLGLLVRSNNGRLPLSISGRLKPADIEIDGSLSSQFLTGLLFAYSALHADKVTIAVNGLNSKPYIDLTLKVMEDFGMALPEHKNYTRFVWTGKEGRPAPRERSYVIESDWSNGAFLLAAGAIAGNVTVKGLDLFSAQADKKILEALQDCGCRMSIQADQIEVSRNRLRPFHFDATDCPDLFPPLVALAAACEGTSIIEGAERLVHKESNRAFTLQDTFARLGIAIDQQDGKMIIKGGTLKGGAVYSHNDHRIAMAAAIAGLVAKDPVTISGAEAVSKSYPGFYNDLQQLAGGCVQVNKESRS